MTILPLHILSRKFTNSLRDSNLGHATWITDVLEKKSSSFTFCYSSVAAERKARDLPEKNFSVGTIIFLSQKYLLVACPPSPHLFITPCRLRDQENGAHDSGFACPLPHDLHRRECLRPHRRRRWLCRRNSGKPIPPRLLVGRSQPTG